MEFNSLLPLPAHSEGPSILASIPCSVLMPNKDITYRSQAPYSEVCLLYRQMV